MESARVAEESPAGVMLFGGLLLFAAVFHHVDELLLLDNPVGPALALLLDGTPAVVLVLAGYRLWQSSLNPAERWTVSTWTVVGSVAGGLVIGGTLAVRAYEGRPLVEPVFPLLTSLGVGGVAGAVAGYFNARAQRDARRAAVLTDALSFVNSVIRHDLLNDLTTIRGHADVLAEGHRPESVETISRKTDEATERIETSRSIVETVTGDGALEPVDLTVPIEEVAAQTRETTLATVTTDCPETATVRANRGLRSIVDNLVENAVEHAEGTEPRVHVAVTQTDETVRLAVADDGPGIDEATARALFDDSSGAASGLSIVDRLVAAYDGEVWAVPRPEYDGLGAPDWDEDDGIVFVVDLPSA
ncbi:ATP-binding protein [Halomicroarcula sp. GCM10025709]|uniref:ATP-binding protein n=1 Tax=Haloarcula TaxID=2237 RepID=UPI0024C3BBB8|nr:ATP-binding protein [Halomicroarcula sp. YJ-61-S]